MKRPPIVPEAHQLEMGQCLPLHLGQQLVLVLYSVPFAVSACAIHYSSPEALAARAAISAIPRALAYSRESGLMFLGQETQAAGMIY